MTMYFEIENTPEHIKRARKTKQAPDFDRKEECPRLVIAPFCRPPQVIFDNVPVGSTAQRELEILNPGKNLQEITLGRALPPGLIIQLPGDWMVLEAETCYCLTLQWTPLQATALRETIRFTDESRGRYDVTVVLKSLVQQKPTKIKSFKISPKRIKKKSLSKRSPIPVYEKKSRNGVQCSNIKQSFEIIQNSVKYKTITSYKESQKNIVNNFKEKATLDKCPFDSPCAYFDTSEVFANVKRNHNTYNKENTPEKKNECKDYAQINVLKPSNKHNIETDIFENLTFTPLKNLPQRIDKLDKGPKITVSCSSLDDFNDSLEISNKENITQYNICTPLGLQISSNPNVMYVKEDMQNKKIPNTSSPKELESFNFTMNTDFSRISNDMSFMPQRFSTERKAQTVKVLNENFYDMVTYTDLNSKCSSDTYTKSISPNKDMYPSMNYNVNIQPYQQKNMKGKQSLFKEHITSDAFERNFMNINRHEPNALHFLGSPTRSITPPLLQAILEESTQGSDTKLLDKTDQQMTTFTINRTFNKQENEKNMSSRTQSWSKKSIRCEPELWKIPMAPPKKSMSAKDISLRKHDKSNKTHDISTQNSSVLFKHVGDAYSQSFTVDPFLSTTYMYDVEAVDKFETEFKRWLNYILTPPADLDTNIEHKIDFGKAWIENRNKEIPVAPTKEQVCSKYHNSHRLESLRRAAHSLLINPEITQIFQKLNIQIEKKLIAVRNDKNLHLDVGLQKIIMELLLSYNPLWLRIGLEAIYGLIIPLKSNSDVEGLSTFIIQRMFKNPYLKNKNSKSSAPNMLLPSYIDSMKKFTLKKFFMLVLFLDRAKQKKLIGHDPCLFCRNAICKESRELLIRFTRELIAGIGDITKHLRPLGYVVSHKQSYLDEYKYAVHNIAADIRDGVRLTKVMEIILIKNNLMMQMRTPAISRLQKVHNVQVALNALKEASFSIDGDISAHDIADGHREKTLSLLWQIIHVFRAPLFEKAANVIQTWWRKKYEVIRIERKAEEEYHLKRMNAASTIQCWWRSILYNRVVELKEQELTAATIVLQKYYRMWICRQNLQKFKKSVLKLEQWWRSVVVIRQAKRQLAILQQQHIKLRHKSATVIQSYVRRWLCMQKYKCYIKKIVKIQSVIRGLLQRNKFMMLKKSVKLVQQKYRAQMIMRIEVARYKKIKNSAIIIQSYFRMVIEYRKYMKMKYARKREAAVILQKNFKMWLHREQFKRIKNSVKILQSWWRSLIVMKQAKKYLANLREEQEQLRNRSAMLIQSHIRRWICVQKYQHILQNIVTIQSIIRMSLTRNKFIQLKKSVILVQRKYRAKLMMRRELVRYREIRESVVVIQSYYRMYVQQKKYQQMVATRKVKAATVLQSYCKTWLCRKHFIVIKTKVVTIQKWWRNLILIRNAKLILDNLRQQRLQLRNRSAVKIQSYVRRWLCMRQYKIIVLNVIKIQTCVRRYLTEKKYFKLKQSVLLVQKRFRAEKLMKTEVQKYRKLRNSAIIIQSYVRMIIAYKKYQRYKETRKVAAATILQKCYRMWLQRRRFQILKRNVQLLQVWWRNIVLKRNAKKVLAILKEEKLQLRHRSATLIQSSVKQWLCKREFKRIVYNVIKVQSVVRCLIHRKKFLQLKSSVVLIQQKYRAQMNMRIQSDNYQKLKCSAIIIQSYCRMFIQLRKYKKIRTELRISSAVILQKYVRRWLCKQNWQLMRNSAIKVQRWLRSIILIRRAKISLAELRTKKSQLITKSATLIQSHIRMWLCVKKYKYILKMVVIMQSVVRRFLVQRRIMQLRHSVTVIQQRYRANLMRRSHVESYSKLRNSSIIIQSYTRMFIVRKRYIQVKRAVSVITEFYKAYIEMCKSRIVYLKYKKSITIIQSLWRGRKARLEFLQNKQAIVRLQQRVRANILKKNKRKEYLEYKKIVYIIRLQSVIRGYLVRKEFKVKKEQLKRLQEEKRIYWAASKIQAAYRGHLVRRNLTHNPRVAELRRRWREGALLSSQKTIRERNEEVLDIIANMYDIEMVIRAFKFLESLTESFPGMYYHNADDVVDDVFTCMSVTNRSISSVELLTSAASVLVNLTRYSATGLQIYSRTRIHSVLKFMSRFCSTESQLICTLCTYLWLFNKYDAIRKDLMEFLKLPENFKILVTIKTGVERMQRMAMNRFHTPQPKGKLKFDTHFLNMSTRANYLDTSYLPILEPDYGMGKAEKKYFNDPQKAIHCIFKTYKL